LNARTGIGLRIQAIGSEEVMRKVAALLVSILLCALCIGSTAHSTVKEQTHEEWLADRIKEVKSITVGMSRADLLKVFDREGGLQIIPAETYVLKSCLLIKVNVKFDPTLPASSQPVQDKDLKIETISEPYLGYVVLD
jgi:hypothetical protein